MKTALLLIAFSLSSLAQQSQYTSVDPKDCVTVNSSELQTEPEIDFYEAECAGFGGYRVEISGGDLRYNLKLSFNGVKIDRFVRHGAFHDMGSKKIEWRYERISEGAFDKRINYKALIFRINSYIEGQNTTQLYVVKLDGLNSCTVAVVNASNDMNARAVRIADDIENHSCL